jgi:hypothetical protein
MSRRGTSKTKEDRIRTHGEVFTRSSEVMAMVDLVADDATALASRFLEPACGDGNFLVEILRRKLHTACGSTGARAALGTQERTGQRHEHEKSEHPVLLAVDSLHGIDLLGDNIERCRRRLMALVDETVMLCPTLRAVLWTVFQKNIVQGDALSILAERTHAMFSRPFDVVIGNPPYQRQDGGFGRSASPLFHHFVQRAIDVAPRHIVMIVPSRWFSGGKGLTAFRDRMLTDDRVRVLVDHVDARNCFPDVDIAGGVCFFRWDRDERGPCRVTHVFSDTRSTSIRSLSEFERFVRHDVAASIVRKVRALGEPTMDALVSSRKPFGLDTKERPGQDGDVILRWQHGEGPFRRQDLRTGHELVDRWKVITSYVAVDHGGNPDRRGQRRVFSRIEVLPPGVVCNETYLVVFASPHADEAHHTAETLRTRFVRFLVAQAMVSHHITRSAWMFVPQLPCAHSFSDDALFARYGLTEVERDFVMATIRPAAPRRLAGVRGKAQSKL